MANPRQRSKARSSKNTKPSAQIKRRIHHKLRKAPALKGPEVLQKSWDKKKTVFQNYAALGLLPSIPLPTTSTSASSSRTHKAKLPAAPDGPKMVGFGRIIRDDEGNVVDIIIPDDDDEDDEEGDEDVDMGEEEGGRVEAKTDVVRSLELLASTSQPVIRHPSTSERTWLQNLVQAHGDDYAGMARDRKLNVWQKTEGELRRMVKKAGGRERLSR